MRKLDAAIAEALGYEVEWKDFPLLQPSETENGKPITAIPVLKDSWVFVRRYSTDGNAMLGLVNLMQLKGWYLTITNEGSWERKTLYYARFMRPLTETNLIPVFGDGSSNDVSLAVALAAYKALTGEEWRDA